MKWGNCGGFTEGLNRSYVLVKTMFINRNLTKLNYQLYIFL